MTQEDTVYGEGNMQSMHKKEKEKVIKEFDAKAKGSELIKETYRGNLKDGIESKKKALIDANGKKMTEREVVMDEIIHVRMKLMMKCRSLMTVRIRE